MTRNLRSILCILFLACFSFACTPTTETQTLTPPNILWITCEDLTPMLGCYGDTEALTPNLDALAAQGDRYINAFATAPVCSPSRSAIITGVYATSLGTQHLRSTIAKPDFIKGFPEYLREHGYYCTNNYKEDYNFEGKHFWDESSNTAHWRNRQEGQPFFSVFNLEMTHQSKIFGTDSVFQQNFGQYLSVEERHDPADVPLPPYYPDNAEIRKLIARYYDLTTLMDKRVGEILAELEADGLRENTIVFFYSDHGVGLPRGKRALYDSGLQVPLIVYAPEKWREKYPIGSGTVNDRVVTFVDFAPTVLQMLGIELPDYLEGTPFLSKEHPAREYAFGSSDRVDEAYELSRSVRSKDFLYIRNYLPQLPLIQPNFYTDQSEIMQALLQARKAGGLNEVQQAFWQPKRSWEELYDVKKDPHQIHNLAADPAYRTQLEQLRKAHFDWVSTTHDTGLLPESYMNAQMEAQGKTPYEIRLQEEIFPVEEVIAVSQAAQAEDTDQLLKQSKHPNEAVAYWALKGLETMEELPEKAIQALHDICQNGPSAERKLSALYSLCQNGDCSACLHIIPEALAGDDQKVMLAAARTFQLLGSKADPVAQEVKAFLDALKAEIGDDWSQYYKLYTSWALGEAFIEKENRRITNVE